MRLISRPSTHHTSPPSPLRMQLVRLGGMVIGVLSVALLLCMGVLLFSTSSTARVLSSNHLFSAALQQVDTLLEAADAFRQYPDAETQGKLDQAFADMDALLQQFDQSRMPEGQRALVHAILQTYDTYQESLSTLYSIPMEQYGSQPFYIQFYAAQEVGEYIDTYLKQLIQRSLTDEHDSYSEQIRLIRLAPVLIGVLIILLAVLLYRFALWLYRRVVAPLFRLSDAAAVLVKKEMVFPDIPIHCNDEIGALTRNFNQMKNDCRQLLVTQKERDELTRSLFDEHVRRTALEQQLSDARFDALRNQINPHFLFNTLTLLVQTAAQENADETKMLIQQLSDLLRYNLYNTDPRVSLQQEIDILHRYIRIQETRFRNRIFFWIDCRIDADRIEIPTFTLQPLVENSVRHGMRNKTSGGQIRVRIWERDGFVHITITDNGTGMDRKTLEELRFGTHVPKRKDSGIGVGNVAARLKILYPESSFHIFSAQGLGTCIRLIYPMLPINPNEKEGDPIESTIRNSCC